MEDPWVLRPSLLAAVERFLVALGTVSTFLLPVAASTLFFGDRQEPATGLFAIVNVLYTIAIPVALSLVPAIQLAFTKYTIDDDGLREQVQLLTKSEKRIKWEKVTALQHRRTILDRALGIERLDVIAYGERGTTLKLVGLRDAPALRNLVAKQMRREATVGRLFSND